MSKASKRAAVAGSVIAVVVVAALIIFGVVGITQTVRAGTQATVCGVDVGVTSSEETVRLLGVSDSTLAVGDRVRVSALCVIEIVSVDNSDMVPGHDGASAKVQLRWTLW